MSAIRGTAVPSPEVAPLAAVLASSAVARLIRRTVVPVRISAQCPTSWR